MILENFMICSSGVTLDSKRRTVQMTDALNHVGHVTDSSSTPIPLLIMRRKSGSGFEWRIYKSDKMESLSAESTKAFYKFHSSDIHGYKFTVAVLVSGMLGDEEEFEPK